MERYKNLSGKSNIHSYELNVDSIAVMFNDGWFYSYSNMSAGSANVSQMKTLASNGLGLNGFIMKNVKKLYERKWK
nr:hypothetical protein [uncultured Polynucleobacter sp.]